MNWPNLGRREAHPGPFRAGQDAPTGAHGDRGRFPTDKDSRRMLGSLQTSSAARCVPFQDNRNEMVAPLRLEGGRGYTPAPRNRGWRGVLHF